MIPFVSPNREDLFGATDSETIMNAVRAAVNDGSRRVVIPRYNLRTDSTEWRIAETILLPSDFTLVLDNCKMVQETGAFCPMIANENSLLRAQTEQTAQRNIAVIGEGNVCLSGGVHNGLLERTSGKYGLPTGIALRNPILLWINTHGIRVENLHIEDQRHWAINHVDCSHATIKNMDFWAAPHVPNMDGIDLRIGCHDFEIENVTGRSGDDTIALTAISGFETAIMTEGRSTDIRNVKIRNVLSDPFMYLNVRLLSQDGNRVHDIDIDTVMDTSEFYTKKNPIAAISLGTQSNLYVKVRPPYPEDTYHIHAKNVYSRGSQAIRIDSGCVDSLFENVKTFSTCYFGIGSSGFGTTLHNVLVDGFYAGTKRAVGAATIVENLSGTPTSLTRLHNAHGELTVKNANAAYGIDHLVTGSGDLTVTLEECRVTDYAKITTAPETRVILNGKEHTAND